ncbi:hypothetical protein PAPHI01_0200 [Pancytospora philotis]|nr:hypothetical protein PAPHI01_0200 [Pancytospora philotis]
MLSRKADALFLLVGLLGLLCYHFLPVLSHVYQYRRTVYKLKERFNSELERGAASAQRLRSLKVLINNFALHQNKEIMDVSSDAELRNMVDALEFTYRDVWEYQTVQFQMTMLAPLLLPPCLYIIKCLFK